jgi:autotransporter-associated beta strand protein
LSAALVASLVLSIPVRAANVSLTASDGVGTSSFNTAGKWSNTQAPSAANDYFTGSYFMRTPGTAGNYTFAGNSLTLQQPVLAGVRSIIFKGGNNDVLTINNLTNAFGGILENGGSGAATVTFTGNLFTIAGNSAVVANQGPLILGYPLAGADGVILTNAGGNATGITYNGDNSAFKGKFYISTINFGNGGGATRVTLNAANSQPANPSVLTPDQILLEAGCTLIDNVGLTFNNANGGITLAGSATINAAATTLISEPITDNGSGFALTKAGAGTLTLSGANTYSGGTIVSAGTLQIGASGTLPVATVTVNGTLDLNGFNTTVNSLAGSGTVDSMIAGTVTLTVGTNDGSGTFTGTIQNSGGTLNLTKIGTGAQTLSGYTYSGRTLVAGGSLNLSTAVALPSSPGDLVVSNGAVVNIDASIGTALPANNVTVGTNSTMNITVLNGYTALNVSGTLTVQSNGTNTINLGTLTANPTVAAINAANVTASGPNAVLKINAVGLQFGSFPLIQYSGSAPSLANFVVEAPPGVAATLQINAGASTIEVNVSSSPKNLSWYGSVGTAWDFSTINWKDASLGDVAYQQYTNGSVIAGDAARFDDTLYNDFVNPQPTNITLNATVYPFPLVFDTSLPYSISGSGGIAGTTSLVKSNTGSVTLNTANTYSGGTYVYGGSVLANSDAALGAAGKAVTIGGGTLEFSANASSARPVAITAGSSAIGVSAGATAQLSGTISSSSGLTKVSNGTLTLSASNAITGALSVRAGTLNLTSGTLRLTGNPSYVAYLNGPATMNMSGSTTLNSLGEFRVGGSDLNGAQYDANGIFNMSGGNAYLNSLTIARGNYLDNNVSGEANISGGILISTNDVLVAFAGTGKGTLRISGTATVHVGTTTTKWLRFGQYDTTSGEIAISGGNLNLNQGTSIKFNQNNSSGPKTFNQDGGSVTFYSDFATTIGGAGDLDLMLTGTAAATNTYNLNGGTLTVPTVRSSGNSGTRIFNFNGGTLRPTASSSTFFNLGTGSATANVRNGGAIIDDRGFNITIAQPLVHSAVAGDNATDGGLTKKGTGSLTLNGASTYNGPTAVNAGSLLMTTASLLSGNVTISNNATLSISQIGSATKTVGNLTFNGVAAKPGATFGLALTAANDPAVPVINCGTLTLNGTNTISLAGAVQVGTIKLIKALGAVAGSGNVTNLVLPQGAAGTISSSFDGTYTTISAVITSTGPGLVWTGGINNLWDINTSTNWLLNSTVTTYQQTIIPGDAVTFGEAGSGTVILNTSAGPASLVVSNNSKAYTFSGTGSIAGPTGLVKAGSGTAVLNLTNNSYTGDTTINGGSLQFGVASGLPASGNLVVNSGGTLQMAGLSLGAKELIGSGVVNNGSGLETLLTIGSSAGGTWNGTVTNSGGGIALRKAGTGTWVLGGQNYFDNGQSFSFQNQINQGTVIITNGGALRSAVLQVQIANGAGQTGTVVVAGGILSVTNNVLSVGYGSATADGTLIVNSGTVDHSGFSPGSFSAFGINCIDVGAQGANGRLIVNGGQVLNDQPLYLGDGATSSGTLQLNGGSVRASVVQPNGTPLLSAIYFNGGTLQAATNTGDFILSSAFVQSGGAVIDDGGKAVSLVLQGLQEDPSSTGGGLIKKGSGTLYLDSNNSHSGTTVVTNGTLAGIGSVSGPVVVAPAGTIGAGDAGGIGTLSINNTLTVQGKAAFRISKDGGSPANDQIAGVTTATYGGALVITNVTADATPLANGDTFTLLSASTHSGNFSSIVGSPGTGLVYKFTNGILSVVTGPSYSTNPTNITVSVSGGTLTLSWPADHLGWILQTQTNSLSTGLNTNWYDVPGSSSSTQAVIGINPANPATFYRLRLP